MKIPSYDNQLLHLCEDLARRLLPAFDTPTGILLEHSLVLTHRTVHKWFQAGLCYFLFCFFIT